MLLGQLLKNNFCCVMFLFTKFFLKVVLSVSFILLFLGCKKQPGEGGFATITGRLYVKNYDPTFTVLLSEYYLPGESVYIKYGDNNEVGDNVRTTNDGTFTFNYLRKGKYKVYAIGKDNSKPSLSVPKETLIEIEIKEKKQIVNLGDLVIIK
jgi:hypothetical protein